MRIFNFILIGLLVSLNLPSFGQPNSEDSLVPNSSIPNRREFPVDPLVDPCVDFHAYACGPVERSFKLREDRSTHTFAFGDSAERLLHKKMSFFKNIEGETSLGPREKQFKSFYLACMNDQTGGLVEVGFLQKMVSELKEINTAKDFMAYQINRIKNGSGSLFQFESGSNMTDPNTFDIALSIKLMNLPEHSYYENAIL